jgi:Family of unknown function (DUF6157)
MHSTKYSDTFIAVAEDCPVEVAEIPPMREQPTAAQIQYEMLAGNPYQYTSDDVLYAANGQCRGISREEFFSKGQPCFRSSPLTKRYGWGVHSDSDGKIAIFPIESPEYARLAGDASLRQLTGMRSARR